MYLSVGRSGYSEEEDDEKKTNPNHYFRQIKIILHFASLFPRPTLKRYEHLLNTAPNILTLG